MFFEFVMAPGFLLTESVARWFSIFKGEVLGVTR